MNDTKNTTQVKTDDEIFVSRPTPTPPPSKKSVLTTVLLTLGGVLILFLVLIFSLYGSASSLARNYGNLAQTQLQKIEQPLANLSPTKAINNKNIQEASEKIYISKQSQPELESIIFVGGINQTYKLARELNENVKTHYKSIDTYTADLNSLLDFDTTILAIVAQNKSLEKKAKPTDSLSVRSVGGNYQSIAEDIAKLEVSGQLKQTQQDLVASYQQRAKLYEDWAKSVESGKDTEKTTKALIKKEKDKVALLITDKNLAELFNEDYQALLKNQKTLKSSLSNL